MPVTMTAREVKDEDIRRRAWERASVVEAIDPGLARALRNLARDIGTEDEQPGSVALLTEEPYAAEPEPSFGVSMLAAPGTWMPLGR